MQDQQGSPTPRNLQLTISDVPAGAAPLASSQVQVNLSETSDPLGRAVTFTLDHPLTLDPAKDYAMTIELAGAAEAAGVDSPIELVVQGSSGNISQEIPPQNLVIRSSIPAAAVFQPETSGVLSDIYIDQISDISGSGKPKTILVSINSPTEQDSQGQNDASGGNENQDTTIVGTLTFDPAAQGNSRYHIQLETPIPVQAGERYQIQLSLLADEGMLNLSGGALANEGDWDDGLPLRMDGYDPFGGLYPLDLNFNMYLDDNPDKLARFERILDQSEYLVITSNRQWGSLPRIPERFPMTTVYYRNLLGCPEDKAIGWCYSVAKPGMFKGDLGYDLVQIFQNDPKIGPIQINDQFAEEAFTVYDHPKVLVFKKNADYNPQKVADILGAVDFSHVLRLPPIQFPPHPADLMLPIDRLAAQRLGGTWAELFDTSRIINLYPGLAAVLWYVCIFLLGLIVFPIMHWVLPGLTDKGYPLARTAGMLLLSYFAWLLGSYQVPFTRSTIGLIILGLVIVGMLVTIFRWKALKQYLRENWKYILVVEGIALAFFLVDIGIRLGNPDLWHPFKGGEKPMDFSYFNAVLKSTSFPPYDPWYAGGYLNYYYYGFVFVGTLVKLLGIVPSIAYNLILPTVFTLIALGGFSIGYNLISGRRNGDQISESPPNGKPKTFHWYPILIGLATAIAIVVLGNLGTVKMIYQGYQRLAAPEGNIEDSNLITRLTWSVEGFGKVLSGRDETRSPALRRRRHRVDPGRDADGSKTGSVSLRGAAQ